MWKRRSVRAAAIIVAVAVAAAVGAAAVSRQGSNEALPLQRVASVPLPGPSNRFDYTSLDPTTGRLYIAHMNAGQLLVFDVRKRRVVQDDRGAGRPRRDRRAAAPSRLRLGHRRAAAVHDRQPHRPRAQPRAGRRLPRRPRLRPGRAARVRLRRERRRSRRSSTPRAAGSRRSSSAARPATSSTTPASGKVLADVQSRDEVAVIDPRSNRVVRRVALPGCDHPHGLLVDSPRRLAFVACDGNATPADARPRDDEGDRQRRRRRRARTCSRSTRRSKRLYVAAEIGRRRRVRRARPEARQARPGAARAERAHRRRRPAHAPRLLPARTRQRRHAPSCGS